MPTTEPPVRGNPLALVAAVALLAGAASLLAADAGDDTTSAPSATAVAAPVADADTTTGQPTSVAARPATTPDATTAGATAEGPVAPGSTTAATMTEFAFDLPDTFAAGTHTFEVTNAGVAPHEFALGAVGDHHGHLAQTTQMAGGATETLTVDLEPGTYEIGCHVPGHYEAGMSFTITVVP